MFFFSTTNDSALDALIIDDELDICFLLKSILKKRDLDVNYVNRLEDAKIALKNNTPPIIFLDNHLPDGLGIDFISYVKTNYPATKIIMITAHDTPEDRTKAVQQGVDMFLGKPFTKDAITMALNKLSA
jgi:two-component system, OmpR family, response regulator